MLQITVRSLRIVCGLYDRCEGANRQETLDTNLHRGVRNDRAAAFTAATCAILLVFYILTARYPPASVVVLQKTREKLRDRQLKAMN